MTIAAFLTPSFPILSRFLFFCFPFSSSPSIFPSFHLLARSFGSLRIGAPSVCRYWWKEQPAEARGRRPPQRGTSISHPNPPAVSGPISLTRTPPCPRHQTKQSNTAFSVSARDPPSHPARRLVEPLIRRKGIAVWIRSSQSRTGPRHLAELGVDFPLPKSPPHSSHRHRRRLHPQPQRRPRSAGRSAGCR